MGSLGELDVEKPILWFQKVVTAAGGHVSAVHVPANHIDLHSLQQAQAAECLREDSLH